MKYVGKKKARILDVGCGNNIVKYIKKICPNCYYIGVDVGDYNLDLDAKAKMDEYHVVKAADFADKIKEFRGSVDIVVSSHNIEHCNEPVKVLENMVGSLRLGGVFIWPFHRRTRFIFPQGQAL